MACGRYAKFKEIENSTIGFRLYAAKMGEEASKDAIASQSGGIQRSFTQMIQASQTIMEGLEDACCRLFLPHTNYVQVCH